MIGKRKDRKSTRQFSIKEKEQIISDFKSSGLSAREFALTIDVASATLGRWVKAYDKGKLEKPKKIKRGGPYSIHDRKQAIEAYYKSGMNQHDFAKTWGCSEITLNRWISQYKKYGIKGLEGSVFKEENTRRRGPRGISRKLKDQIVETKKENDQFGLRKIKDFLRRFRGVEVSTKTISKTLKEEDIPLLPKVKKKTRSSDRIRTFERAKPMQLWQTDITSYVLTRNSQRVYFTVFMDDCSRYIVSWSLQLMQTSEFVMSTLLSGIEKFGNPEEVLSDQGRQYFAWRGESKFQNLLIREGIEHVVARSHHPQTVGKCERFWETVSKEFWERVRPQELNDARERLGHFINYYNHFRPHQGLDGMVPADRFFGVENEVRKVLEETIEKNSLRLALDESPRTPVFLIGQIGNTPLSMHGESGQLILQTAAGTVQKLSYNNFGHSNYKGEDDGRKSGDNKEGTQTERKEEGVQSSGQDSAASENSLEDCEPRGEGESSCQRSGLDGVLDRDSEQGGNCQEIGNSSSSNMATVSASSLGNAGGTTDTTENTSERDCDEFGRRSEDTQEEDCGVREDNRSTGEIDSCSSDDAGMLRGKITDGRPSGEGEFGCKEAIRETQDTEDAFNWPWENYSQKKKE